MNTQSDFLNPLTDLIPPDEVRNTALQTLTVVMRGDASLDALLERELRGEHDEQDKRLLYELCMGVFRWQAKLDWVLNGFYHGEYLKCLPQMKNALRIALYSIMYMPEEPQEDSITFAAAFVESLKGAQSAEAATNILSHIANSLDHIRYPDRKEDLYRYAAVVGSHPWWLAKRWIERFGAEEGLALMQACNTAPPVALRVNKLQVELRQFIERLEARSIKYVPSGFNETCLSIDTLPAFTHLETYKKGWFTPYTLSSALAVALLDPQPDESVLSLCASTTGKTLHIAEAMLNLGKITAVDRIDARTADIQREAARLGITTITAVTSDPLQAATPIADRVLVDAPGSRIGASARHPAIKWKLTGEMLHHYTGHHLALLMHASQFVKPGGVLLYATESTEPEENEDVVRRFLDASPRFSVDKAGTRVPAQFVTERGFVQTWPHRHGMEGSFAVRLVRQNG